MKAVRTALATLLTIVLVAGCARLIWFSGNSWRAVMQYDRYTLGNYHETLAHALLLSVPACLIIGLHAVTCVAVMFNFDRGRVVRLRRLCAGSLFGFAVLLIAFALWLTVTSRGEGAGYIVYITGPMLGFALVIPTSLGFIVIPRVAPREADPAILSKNENIPRRIAIAAFLVAAVICAVGLMRRFDPIALVFFAPAFLFPALFAFFACSPKRTRPVARGAMIGALVASAILAFAGSVFSNHERLGHGPYGAFDFFAVELIASVVGCFAIGVGVLAGLVTGKVARSSQ